MLEDFLAYDKELLIYLNNLGKNSFHNFWLILTNFVYWTPVLIFIFFYIYRKYSVAKAKIIIGFAILTLLISLLSVEVVKMVFSRMRPCNDPTVFPFLDIVIRPKGFSFFSGHATVSFALTVFLYLTIKSRIKHIGWLFIWPFLFAYSRLYLGVHYPSDILIGIFVGTLTGIVFHRIYNACIVKLRIY